MLTQKLPLLLIVFALLSCKETTVTPQETFELSSDTIQFSADGGLDSVFVSSSKLWVAVDTSSWLHVVGDSIFPNGLLKVQADENELEISRESYLFVNAGAETKKVLVNQAPFVHPSMQPLDLGELIIEEGNEALDLIVDDQVKISSISNCGDHPYYNSHNVILLDENTSTIVANWNHINTTSGEWEGIQGELAQFTLPNAPNYTDDACYQVKVYQGTFVKKYGDWDHQHANGYILSPVEKNVYVRGITSIMLDIYFDASRSHIPTQEELKAYGLSDQQLSEWDQSQFNFDIQLHTIENTHLAYNLTLDNSMADQWLRITIPVENMERWNNASKSISFQSIERHQLNNISLTAETANRLVYRNYSPQSFDANTPKLFKELGIRIKRLEIIRAEN